MWQLNPNCFLHETTFKNNITIFQVKCNTASYLGLQIYLVDQNENHMSQSFEKADLTYVVKDNLRAFDKPKCKNIQNNARESSEGFGGRRRAQRNDLEIRLSARRHNGQIGREAYG